jgi:hypothetical protein
MRCKHCGCPISEVIEKTGEVKYYVTEPSYWGVCGYRVCLDATKVFRGPGYHEPEDKFMDLVREVLDGR